MTEKSDSENPEEKKKKKPKGFSCGLLISIVGLFIAIYGVMEIIDAKKLESMCTMGYLTAMFFSSIIFGFGCFLVAIGLISTIFSNYRKLKAKDKDEVLLIGFLIGVLSTIIIALFLAWILSNSLTSMLTWIPALGIGIPLGILISIKLRHILK